jgi:hypothetical protein
MKRSCLGLAITLTVFMSVSSFATDKVTCFKLKRSGKIKEKEKKRCSGKWADSQEAAVEIAKDKCLKKQKKKGKVQWKDIDGKDGLGRCVKVKGLFKKKLSNNVIALESDIDHFCFTTVMGDKKLCKKAKKKYSKLHKKNCKKDAKVRMKKRNKGLGKKVLAFFKKKTTVDGAFCNKFGKKQLECLLTILGGNKCAIEGEN